METVLLVFVLALWVGLGAVGWRLGVRDLDALEPVDKAMLPVCCIAGPGALLVVLAVQAIYKG